LIDRDCGETILAGIGEPSTEQAKFLVTKKNSGFVRWLNLFSVMSLAVAAIGTSWVLVPLIEIIPGKYPGVDLTAVLIIGLGAAFIVIFAFMAMGALIPRSAPDYVLTSRIISKPFGFASSFLLVVTGTFFIGGVVAWISQQFFADFFLTFRSVFGINEFRPVEEILSSPQNSAIAGSLLFLFIFSMSFLPQKLLKGLFQTGLLVALLSWIILIVQMMSMRPELFIERINALFGPGVYQSHIDIAYQFGMRNSEALGWVVLILGLQVGMGVFFGAGLPTLMAGEVLKAEKRLLPGGLSGLLFAGVLIITAVYLFQRALPWQFMAAESFLYQRNFEGIIIAGVIKPWLPFYIAVYWYNPVLLMLVGIFWFYLLIIFVKSYLLVLSRVVKAWAQDGILPEWAGIIYPGTKTPLIAVLLVTLTALLGLVDHLQGGQFTGWVNFPVFFAVALILPMLALVLYPYRRPEWFVDVPGIIGRRIFGIPLVSITGGLALIYLAAVVLLTLVQPVGLQPFVWQTLVVLGVVYGSGLIFYQRRSIALEKRGTDLRPVFESLPVETE
jgi:amino acid transporter